MVNDNKNDFMSVVNNAAEEYRKRSYEACMEGFMSSMIKEAVTIDAPKNVELGTDEKQAMLDTVTETIKNSANEFVKNAVVEETGTLYNVNVAHEIVNPKNLTESVMQLVSAHVYDEADDRAKMLEADFDAGKINKKLQQLIDSYSEQGWKLHSYKFVDLSTFCLVIFYKEESASNETSNS
jgi:hypothetical protein